jgi:DNA replication protein DnaC
MKHIGEVIRGISIPINTNTESIPASPSQVKCPICSDAGYIRLEVAIGHPSFGKAFPCQCTIERREITLKAKLIEMSNLHAFVDRTFDNFDPTIEGVEEAYEAARSYAHDPEGWLFLQGGCGSGKTHLAVAIAQYALEHRHISVLFSVVPDLLDHLRATFAPNNGIAYDDLFSAVRNAQLLILDDLGTENTTPWAREKLYQLLNYRYNERMPTVITSNQSAKNIDERVFSRLVDTRLTQYVNIDAEDYRLPASMRINRPQRRR